MLTLQALQVDTPEKGIALEVIKGGAESDNKKFASVKHLQSPLDACSACQSIQKGCPSVIGAEHVDARSRRPMAAELAPGRRVVHREQRMTSIDWPNFCRSWEIPRMSISQPAGTLVLRKRLIVKNAKQRTISATFEKNVLKASKVCVEIE
jgi:hypothetical protein